jgi:hypothetical protein
MKHTMTGHGGRLNRTITGVEGFSKRTVMSLKGLLKCTAGRTVTGLERQEAGEFIRWPGEGS